jgi:hypothetical protein
MRLGSNRQTHRILRIPAAILFGAATILLSSCQSETPTEAGGGAPTAIREVPMLAGAAQAARAVTNRLARPWATIPRRTTTPALTTNDGNINSPFDLTYYGGAVVNQATSWNLYVNCPSGAADCWGNGYLSPATFLNDLSHSSMIKLANQYLGSNAYGRFPVRELRLHADPPIPDPVSDTAPSPTTSGNTFYDIDIIGMVISAGQFTGATGYNNIYHVFLPAGTDVCWFPGFCYSPDDPNSFAFCAYHGWFDDLDGNHYLYTVEPYQNVDGCRFPYQIPHGTIDATASTLSHEFFETITDPDLDAWFNSLTGEEIGDLCAPFHNNERLGNHSYVIQSEYSNEVHNCTDR